MGAFLITGAAKRLGAAMATHLAKAGEDVVIHCHQSEADARELAQKLTTDFGVQAGVVVGDLRNRERLTQLIPEAQEAIGRDLSGLINNASVMIYDRVDEEFANQFEIWDDNFKTNLEAPYFLTRAFAQQCKNDGVVINMIDQRVWRHTPNYGAYALAKSALLTFTQTAAQALGPHIRVNGIGPGSTLIGAHQSQESFERHRKLSILERGADVEDILQALDYLRSAKAVTGQMIAVDGGQHLIWQLPQG